MQGKERNQTRIDAPFTDHAWTEMRNMLDQEMPQSPVKQSVKGSKKYVLLLLFLLVGFIAGVGTMMYFDPDPIPSKPEQKQLQSQEVASMEPPEGLLQTPETSASVAIGGGGIQPGNKSKSVFSQSKPLKQIASSAYDQKPYANSSIAIVNSPGFSPTKNQATERRFDGNHGVIKSSEPASISSDQIASALPNLQTLDIHPKVVADQDKLEFVEMPQTSKIRFGMRLSNHTRRFNDFAGFTIGTVINVALDPEFSLESGIQYSVLCGFQKNADESQINYAPFERTNREDMAFLDQFSSIQHVGINKDLPIGSLHYIDLPVSLIYSPVDQFRIHMGVKASYLIYTNADGHANVDGLDPTTIPDYRDDRDQALYESMKKIDFGTVLGFGYYPTDNFGIDLRYNHGLIDNTIDEIWEARQITTNKSFELSLTYLLSSK